MDTSNFLPTKKMSKSHRRKNSQLFLQNKNSSNSVLPQQPASNQSSDEVVRSGSVQPFFDLEREVDSFGFEDVSASELNHPIRNNGSNRLSEDFEPLSQWSNWYLNGKYNYKRRPYFLLVIGVIMLLTMGTLLSYIYWHGPTATERQDPSDFIPDLDDPGSRRNIFTIEEILHGEFSIKEETFHFIDPPEWLKSHDQDPGLYFTVEQKTGQMEFIARQLFDRTFEQKIGKVTFEFEGKRYTTSSIQINYPLTKAIIATNMEKQYRHSSKAYYWLLDIHSGKYTPIRPKEIKDRLVYLNYAHFSPHYNYIDFNYNNDLYFFGVESPSTVYRITNDGSNIIRNGITDWVYEEEVLSTDRSVWWAPDDSRFIFTKLNDVNVSTYEIDKYALKKENKDKNYVEYPVPGSPNPTIELYQFDISAGVLYTVTTDLELDQPILYYAKFVSPTQFLYKVTDRTSRYLKVKVYELDQNKVHLLNAMDTAAFNGWVEKSKNVFSIPPNKVSKDFGFLDIHPDRNGFNHIFYYPSMKSSDVKAIQLTFGEWEVSELVGFEYESLKVFFAGNREHPMSQHLYAIDLSKENKHESLELLQDPNKKLDYYSFEISKSGRFAKARYLGPKPLKVKAGSLLEVLDVDSAENNNNNVLSLSDDSNFNESLRTYDLPKTSYSSILLNDGTEINIVEIKPSYIDPERKYPILVSVYGGPGSKTYTTKSSVFFEQAVAQGLDTIVLQIEPRGTGGKGWEFKSWARKNIGHWEPKDIIETTKKYIELNSPHIDTDKVAIWGWSYGGYTTLKTIEQDSADTFKYGIAVAPVTDWLSYDSIYTERYMGLPDLNEEGYENAKIKNISAFEKLTRLFVIHGTADDNVHIENTFSFVDKLNEHSLSNYDMHIFPGSDHSISHHNGSRVLFRKLYNWIKLAFHPRAFQ